VDTLGIEPRASRMLSGRDTTTPCAHVCLQALVDPFARFRYRRRQHRRDRRRCAAFVGYSTPRRQAAQQRRSLLSCRHRYRKHAFMRNVLCEWSLPRFMAVTPNHFATRFAIPQAKDWLEQAHSDLSQGPADLQPAARCHAFRRKVLTLAGLEPAIFASEDQRLIH
jgi:hypothetical protein